MSKQCHQLNTSPFGMTVQRKKLPCLISPPDSAQPTLNDGEQDDDDKEEESDVEDDAVEFVLVPVRSLDLVADATTSPHAFVQVEHKALRGRTRAR